MDADYHGNEDDPNTLGGRKRKGRSKFARVVAQKKPVFDPGVFLILTGNVPSIWQHQKQLLAQKIRSGSKMTLKCSRGNK